VKIINLLYRGGAGGEFFGGLLQELDGVAEKPLHKEMNTERWFLKREDYQSHEIEVTRNDPWRVQKPKWNEKLWNVRLDHGYGFVLNQEFWSDYLWNDWEETKTIIFMPRNRKSLEFTERLAKLKLVKPSDHAQGQAMLDDGILDVDQFWNRPWESMAHYFHVYMETIPDDHDFLMVDPYELLFDSTGTVGELSRIGEYLGVKIPKHWEYKICSYRLENQNLINKNS